MASTWVNVEVLDMKVDGAPGTMTLVVQTFRPGTGPHVGQSLDMWPVWRHLKQAPQRRRISCSKAVSHGRAEGSNCAPGRLDVSTSMGTFILGIKACAAGVNH